MIESSVLTINGYERRYAFSVPEFNPTLCQHIHAGNKTKYCDVVATFDIESTTIINNENATDEETFSEKKPYAFMYHWQMCIGGIVVFGRFWHELQELHRKLVEYFHLNEKRKMVIYVHNLSFEWMFMYQFMDCWENIFATDRNKILKCSNECFEWRCSYRLSNMSLAKFIENSEGTYYRKAEDDLDYRKYRDPYTALSLIEYGYCYNDVAGLYQAICASLNEDTLDSIPLTSTGYVRRDAREAMKKNKRNRKLFLDMKLTPELYELCKEAFRGGDTHGSRYYVNQIVDEVESFDKASSYPYVMYCLPEFPMSKFMEYDIQDENDLDQMNTKYCTLGRYRLTNVKLKKGKTNPYIAYSKCSTCIAPKLFNGRVLESDEIIITLTNIDYLILKKDYDFEGLSVANFYFARKGYLPDELRSVIWQYFEKKTMLKGVENHEYEYMKSKNKLNSIFGMMVTDIVHSDITFDGNDYCIKTPTVEEALNKYYKSRNNFLSYQWGVWVTALARLELRKGIEAVGIDNVYNDTDSVKSLEGHTKDFEKLNVEINRQCKERGIVNYIIRDGKKFYLGTWDNEGRYDQFKTLGAKKYVYTQDGELHLTVSGLDKRKGARYLESIGGVSAFNKGVIFTDSGRTTSYYNYTDSITTMNRDGYEWSTASNIAIVDSEYTLGITDSMLSIILETHLTKP